ncbi:MAG: outer membrane lipoprotein chaperone LolA [Acidiferrobacterales bacterium]|nr:outer membrane lipoprotein chaperone LolA [Acidiferrobacterales bacterium]
MHKLITPILLFATLLLSANSSYASEQLLSRFFQEVDSMQASFEQQVVDESGMTLEQSTGMFYLSRPGKFRWNYNDPYSESGDLGQQIIADGEYIYMFDPDLEQVTQRSMQDAISQVPSLLLVQSGGQAQDHFNITDFGVTDGLSWVSLKPKAEEASYQQLMIGFAGDELRSIVLLDGLGNETRLKLLRVENNVSLSTRLFDFKVPDGADVLVE